MNATTRQQMKVELEARIKEVKLEKATKMYDRSVVLYGSEESALRSLDCENRHEAIRMLAVVQTYSIFKVDGVVRVA